MSMAPVLHSFAYGIAFLREQVGDVSAADMVALPAEVPNHPAWTIGHLAFICEAIGGVVGLSPWLPEGWAGRYGPGSVPVADAGAYEGKERLLAVLGEACERVRGAVEGLDDAALDRAFPDASYQEVFPTVRHALVQVLVGHTAYHVGQVGVWRRAMGLPGLGRSFE